MPRARAIVALLLALLAGCGGGDGDATLTPAQQLARFCQTKPFTPPALSPYRLPYAVGETYTMFQGNCPSDASWGHHGMFAYDFAMPLGTPVRAMRAGTVFFVADSFSNDDHTPGHENGVWVLHADGTVANYLHFSPSSAAVAVDDAVAAGDLLGLSGHSGASDRPHLHVQAYADGFSFTKPNTVPVTFVNAGGPTLQSGELIQDQAYTALPVP
jgi:murein DD-endopeptidase MepM/ murein hydrolase activator NlpD